MKYSTSWFIRTISDHSAVTSASELQSGCVLLERKHSPSIVVAPVSIDWLDIDHVKTILEAEKAAVICLIPKDSHYSWEARERAGDLESDVQTVKELYSSLGWEDPRGHIDKNVGYAKDRLEQHNRVERLEMRCEASMKIIRFGGASDKLVAIEYEYEFTEEALVRALKRHPGADVVLNSNPNGRPTGSALRHAKDAGVALFKIGELMGALNYDGDAFIKYSGPEDRRR
ncbi:hypothetical protein [Streptomyces lavendofoliae]|uniref:Uncharacterized protein n=1 Tax=Streptomyces lavendofoliae TaxID=67314 RepID=A0A918HVB1_9ACTN|nr:hypothetical protein [Streptomyces lavendofoliae]GGU32808.1 hypothetical protein GCM10010274_19850 [Streptomyces lavendofoliae]